MPTGGADQGTDGRTARASAPELKEFVVQEKTETVGFVLKTAKTIRGKIIDADGKPILH